MNMRQQHSGRGDNIAGDKYIIFKFERWIILVITLVLTYYLLVQKESCKGIETKDLLVDLPERWDSSKAANIVLKELSKMKNENEIKKNNFQGEDKLEHFILNFYDYDKFGDNNFSKVAIVYSRPEDRDCHGCGVSMSFIQFIKVESGWKLGEKYIAAIYDGAYGEPPFDIGVFSIGYDILGIIMEGGFTNMGGSSAHKAVFANVGGEFKNVLDFESYEDDSGSLKPGFNKWDSSLEPQKIGTGFYDLILFRTGIKDGKKIRYKTLYRYNGIEYIKIN